MLSSRARFHRNVVQRRWVLELEALVDSVKQFCGDFDALYATVVANECYKDVTKEHVMKYV